MPEPRPARPFPWFGDVSAVGPVGKVGIALMVLGILAGFGALLTWPTRGPGETTLDFAALRAALVVPDALLLTSVLGSALGAVLYLAGYAVALVRWATPRPPGDD
jgi:hypothetical protein